jgi:hypothetical protein
MFAASASDDIVTYATCDIHFTEIGAVMTTVLPVLFKYCYKYCYSDSRKR